MTRVLIVDDKEENVYYLRTVLLSQGFDVESATHGAEALVKARQHRPDLVVSDLLMPVMDGFTLLRHWKADPSLRSIPFIVYTATYTEAEDAELAMSLGADAFILKPAEPDDFLEQIRAVQSRPIAASPSTTVPLEPDDPKLFKVYSATLIRKLEEKTMQLEAVNRTLEQDIAHRKEIEHALRESEARFRRLFESDVQGVMFWNREGLVTDANNALLTMLGFSREDLAAGVVNWRTLTPAEFEERDAQALRELATSGVVSTYEKDLCRKDGTRVPVLIGGAAVDSDRDQGVSFVLDQTERRALEQQFLRAQRMESIGTLAGGIAHDLNNALGPIILSIELLRMQFGDKDAQELLDVVEASAQRGASMVRQVLAFARGVDSRRIDVSVRELVLEVAKITNETFLKHIRVETVLPGDVWPVLGDPTQLHQVLMNLCVNARDAMPDGGVLTIAVENVQLDAHTTRAEQRSGAYVMLRVSDTGIGIPAPLIEKIFDPFFTTKELGKGTGLGLSTSLAIVKSHGGFVNVTSEVGAGTTIRVYLPASMDGAGFGPISLPADLPRGNGELILVVDDEAPVRQITRQALEAFGYTVLLAADGVQAISLYASHRATVAAALVDLLMPVMDGTAAITALRQLNPSLRVIATSGLPRDADQATDIGLDVNHFLAKPFTSEALLRALAATLAGR